MEKSSSVIFLMKWGCWGHWGHWGCWGCWDHWSCFESWWPGNHSVCKVQSVFDFFEAKEAIEVIEAGDVIMSVEVIEATEVLKTTQILKILNLMARITLFWCFEIYLFFELTPEISVEFNPPSELRLWRTGMLLLTKSKDRKSNSHYSGFPNYLQTKSNLHISICQSQIH